MKMSSKQTMSLSTRVYSSNMNYLLARKKSSSSRGRQSEAGSTTGSQKPRESKSTPYTRPSYETELAKRDSFMDTFDKGITKASGEFCQTLLCSEQTYPQDTLFRDDLFVTNCRNIRNRNELWLFETSHC